MTIGVVVADDQAIVRAGFRMLIDSEPDLAVLGEAANGAEAVAVARRTSPDVVLMDIRMPVLDGIEATRRITAAGPLPRVLILTTFDLDEYVFGALRVGASGFMLKERPPEELLSAIRVIAAGEALLAPNITRRLVPAAARRDDAGKPQHDPGREHVIARARGSPSPGHGRGGRLPCAACQHGPGRPRVCPSSTTARRTSAAAHARARRPRRVRRQRPGLPARGRDRHPLRRGPGRPDPSGPARSNTGVPHQRSRAASAR